MLAACSIANAKTYSKGCEVSSCDGGWKVNGDKTKCEANQCLCPNGVGSSGAKCLIDGDPKCESCDAGFKLASDSKSCSGMLGRLYLIFVSSYVCSRIRTFDGIYVCCQHAVLRTSRHTARDVRCPVAMVVGR